MTSPAGAVRHTCGFFRDADDFAQQAADFLAQGASHGEHGILVTTPHTRDAGAAALAAHGLCDVEHLDAAALYADPAGGHAVDAAAIVRAWQGRIDAACARGSTGIRVAADTTVLHAADPTGFLGYEFHVGDLMHRRPMVALCLYRAGSPALADVACVHDDAPEGAVLFHLSRGPGDELVARGELDVTTVDRLARVLELIEPAPATQPLTVDATRVSFVDHRNLQVLEDWGCRHGRRVLLRSDRASVRLLLDLIGARHIELRGAR